MRVLLLLVFTLSLTKLTAQDCVLFAKTEWLKASEIEVVTGDVFPENYVVIGVANFLKSSEMISLESITSKMLNSMQKLAVAHHCTKVFVDFKDLVGNFKDAEGKSLHETHLHYFTIQPLYSLCKNPKPETNE